jgi:hypothetical protein
LPGASLGQLNIRNGGPNGQLNNAIFKLPFGEAGYEDSTAGNQGTSSLGNIPRNAGRGPDFAQVDISFIKHTPITHKLNTEFRADFFNIANHPNFSNPDGNLFVTNAACSATVTTNCYNSTLPVGPGNQAYSYDPSFGRSTTTINSLIGIGTSRQIQFAFKILF